MANEAKIKLIKDTVINSIIKQTYSKLKRKNVSEEKANNLVKITREKLERILDSFDENQLLYNQKIESTEEFRIHLLKLIEVAKEKLIEETSKDRNA